VTGPTASGKTELLDSVFGRGAPSFFPSFRAGAGSSEALPRGAAVISADSMQAYRGMDIGTAKPDAATRSRLPHHLIDIRNPDEQYTAGEFVRLADSLCKSLADEALLPIVSGGTGFYVRNFLCGTSSAPASTPATREAVASDLERLGASALRSELGAADPESAARIGANDIYRLTRAVEILRASGRPPSLFAPSAAPRKDWEFLVIGIERPREELRLRIRSRVRTMFEAGLAGEVEALRKAGYGPSCPGLMAIGYREFFSMDGSSPEEIAQAVELHTIQYAKRQMTFLKALPGIAWLRPDPAELFRKAVDFLSGKPE